MKHVIFFETHACDIESKLYQLKVILNLFSCDS